MMLYGEAEELSDKETSEGGTASSLSGGWNKKKGLTVSLEDAAFSGGKVVEPDGFYGLMPLETLSDGKTVLLQSFDGFQILFRPETGEIQLPFGEETSFAILPMPYYNSNHYDTFFIPSLAGFDSYVLLSADR